MEIQFPPVQRTCHICLNVTQSLVLLDSCGHEFCESCVRRHFRSLVDEGSRRVENFKCPDTSCGKQVTETQLQKYLDFEYFSKLTNKITFEYSLLCPDCRTRIDIMGNPQKWRCFNCYTQICKFCKSAEHNGKCQIKTVYFNEVRTTIQDGELGYCPQCITPFMKDENCDHVTCDNPECCFEFCFFCSVSYAPIYNHGGMYHRSDCRNYEHCEDFQTYYYEGCIECEKEAANNNNEGCKLPTQSKESFMKQLFARAERMSNPEMIEG